MTGETAMSPFRSGLLAGVLIPPFLLPGLAHGQTSDYSVQLPALTVTATKRDQDLYRLDGMADTAEAQDALDRNVRAITQLDRLFPDTQIRARSGNIYANLTVRGQSSPDFYNPSTQVYVDGRPQDQAALGQVLPLDTDTIELLYGPQGTLYGRGTIGGVLSITTRRPGNRLEIDGMAGGGTFDREAAARLSAPLIDGLLYGDIALGHLEKLGDYRDSQGNRIGDTNNDNGRVRLRYAPTGGPLDIMVTAARTRISSDEEQFVAAADIGARRVLPVPSHYKLNLVSFGLDASYDLGFAKLSAITGYQDRELDRTIMGYHTPEDQRTISQELRLASSPGQGRALDYVIGAYYQNLDFERRVTAARQISRQMIDSYALFGETTWHVTDRFDITPGLRFDHEQVDAEASGGVTLSGNENYSALSSKLALGYQISPGLRAYALYSSGFKAGGFTRNVSPANIAFTYDPQTSHNFEIGGKGRLLDGRLSWSAAAYYTLTDDYQIFVGQQPNQYLQNAGEVIAKGLDLKLTALPTDALRIIAGLGINRTEFTAYRDPANPGLSYKGNQVPYAPQVTATLSADYRFLLPGDWGTLVPRVGLTYAGKTYFDEANSLGQDGYALVDAGITWAYNDHLSLTAYADNLTDKRYTTYGFAGAGGGYYQLGTGREIGARLNVKF